MPELSDINTEASFKIHSIDGTLSRPITDLNTVKIASLSTATIASMNDVFAQHPETLKAWGYELLVPPAVTH